MSPHRQGDPEDVQIIVARLEGGLESVHEKLEAIYNEVRATNGRVKKLEMESEVKRALEARNVSDKDNTVKWLLAFVAVGSWLSPIALHFIN